LLKELDNIKTQQQNQILKNIKRKGNKGEIDDYEK